MNERSASTPVEPMNPTSSTVLAVKSPSPADSSRVAGGGEPLADHPNLAVELLKQQIEMGYRLVTFYTACVTAYVAMVGVAVQYYFSALATNRAVAVLIATFGIVLGIFSLASPFGLDASRREIADRVKRYAAILNLPEERFTIVRVGSWLSFPLFLAITCVWIALLFHAS